MQVPYELRPSAVAGTGIFTTVPVTRGAIVWRCDAKSVRTHDEQSLRARIAPLDASQKVDLLEHVYSWQGEVRHTRICSHNTRVPIDTTSPRSGLRNSR